MLYLRSFTFPDGDTEFDFFNDKVKITCFDFIYPFKILSARYFERIEFEPITILYGGNGSGKSTALNVIADKTKIQRDSVYNKSTFYPDYVKMCEMPSDSYIPENSRIITSDDVFDYMLNIRSVNDGLELKRDELSDEYMEFKHDKKYYGHQLTSLENYDQFKQIMKAKKFTQSDFVRDGMTKNVRGYSNGESAYLYFTEKITDNGLYILDEPENSLSPKRQLELMRFIEDSARFFGCQFIISTHSPFLLAMRGAKIYDLDEIPVRVKRWTELENVQIYHEFFDSHAKDFQPR